MLLAARVVTALAQASFLGLGAVVAGQLVPPNLQASAVSTIFVGSTVATMLGAPAGTALGQASGWRAPLAALSVIAALTTLAIAWRVPSVGGGPRPDLRREFAALLRAPMLRALLTTTLGFGGTFTAFTFIAPMLTRVSGLDARWIPAVLLLFGLGMFLGNPVGGRLADWNRSAAVRLTLGCLILVLAALPLVMPERVPMSGAVFLFGAALFATVAPLQMQVMAQAADAPVLASAFNIAAFNLGNAAGAWAGGAALERGVALRDLPWIGVAISLAGLALALLPAARPAPALAEGD